MKMKTAWYGVYILAETDADEKALRHLYGSLQGDNVVSAYEDGSVWIVEEKDESPRYGFGAEEIKAAKLVISINR